MSPPRVERRQAAPPPAPAPIRIGPTLITLAVVSWLFVVVMMFVTIYIANRADDAAHHANDAVSRNLALTIKNRANIQRSGANIEANRALAEQISRTASAAFAKNTCRLDVLAENDLRFRAALAAVIDPYIRGDVAAAQAALPALDAVAAVDIEALVLERCG